MPIWLIQIIVGLVFSVVSTLIKQSQQQDQKRQIAGVKGTIQTGGDNPLAFIMGFYGTAGQLEYAGTWGNDGEVPNAYFTKVVSVSDLPVRGMAGLFVNGERVTVLWGEANSIGAPVAEYRVGGKDHLWIRFYDGTQTTADAFLLSKFGADPDRPWQSDMIGRGVAHFIATALINREIFSGFPEYLAEINGIPLVDPRGDNAHDNPMVAADNVMRGLSYGGQWIYGPQGVTGNRLPAANWQAQMDKCDALQDDGRKRFRFGLEVTVDTEPHALIGELLKACEGRIAEIGGIYKTLVGEPDAPVVSFSDEDIVITDGQSYEPFPGLEETFNAITATYPEPAEAWESKEAPPRYRSDLEALDDGRRLPFASDYKAVPFPVQVQALMRAAIEETRRFRRHFQTMPPEWWEYEPLDTAAWSSARNGYSNKQFLIVAMDDMPNVNQGVSLQEIDPADYGWDSEYELPWDVAPLVIARPAPQEILGWNAAPYVFPDAAANGRRIGIQVFFDEGLVDVRAVRVQVREDFGDNNLVFDGEFPYDLAEVAPSRAMTWAGIINNEDYEVRGIYAPFSGRAVEWSGWIGVKTPNVKLGINDIDITFADIAAEIVEKINSISIDARNAADQIERLGTLLSEQDLANFNDQQGFKRELRKKVGDLEAGFIEFFEVALGPGGAIAQSLTTLYAAMGGDSAQVLVRYQAIAAPDGVSARWAVQVSSDGDTFASAGMYLDLMAGGATRIVLAADQTVVSSGDGTTVFALFDEDGLMVRDITAALIQSSDGNSFWNLADGSFRVSTS